MACKYQIIKILESAKKPLALHEIQHKIAIRFREMHETTAISARIRGDVRPIVRAKGMDVLKKLPPGKYAYVYWLSKVPRKKGAIRT